MANEKKRLLSRWIIICLFLILFSEAVISVSAEDNLKKQALSGLYKAEKDIGEMSDMDLSTTRLNDLFNEAEIAKEQEDYERVISLTDDISNLKQKAVKVFEEMNKNKLNIEELKKLNISIGDAEELLNSASEEFEYENYEDAEVYVQRSSERLDDVAEEQFKLLLAKLDGIKEGAIEAELDISKIDSVIGVAKSAFDDMDVLQMIVLTKDVDKLDKSVEALKSIKADINGIPDEFNKSRFYHVLGEAELALNLGEYEKVALLGQESNDLMQKALRINEDIEKTKLKLEEMKGLNLDVSDAQESLNSCIVEFRLNNFEEAEIFLQESNEKLDKVRADSLLFGTISKSKLKFSIIDFIKGYWWLILIFVILLAVFGKRGYSIIARKYYKRRIGKMESELKVVRELMKNTQRKYFVNRTLSKPTFETTMDEYQEKTIKINKEIPLYKEKLNRLIKDKSSKDYPKK